MKHENDLHGVRDASVWARAFVELFPDADEDLMLGWFANAIETGYEIGRGRARQEYEQKAIEQIESSKNTESPAAREYKLQIAQVYATLALLYK